MTYDNIFCLTTGRSGSKTLYHALSYAGNYTVGHETKRGMLGHQRFVYPFHHIEIDNRLVWWLPILVRMYPPGRSFWIHLRRDRESCVKSLESRSIVFPGYATLVQREGLEYESELRRLAESYYDDVEALISSFLQAVPQGHRTTVHLEWPETFAALWHRIGAEGPMVKAIEVFKTVHNARA